MIHIVKEKKGFAVKSVADNGELLQSSETLNSKASCWKNIRAMREVWGAEPNIVQDDTVKGAPKVWYVTHYGEQFANEAPKPRYIAGKNPKHKKK